MTATDSVAGLEDAAAGGDAGGTVSSSFFFRFGSEAPVLANLSNEICDFLFCFGFPSDSLTFPSLMTPNVLDLNFAYAI